MSLNHPGKSIAHFDIEAKRVVYCSFDLETSGEHGGVIRVSAQLFRPNPVDPTGEDFMRVQETFNRYIRPPDGAIWNEQACRLSHGLSSSYECIQNARDFAFVWTEFTAYISRHISPSERCVPIAWNGKTCDWCKLWPLCRPTYQRSKGSKHYQSTQSSEVVR
jgi:hypothetical protein